MSSRLPINLLHPKYYPDAGNELCEESGVAEIGFQCTRTRGHSGAHVACGNEEVFEIWGGEDEGIPYFLADFSGGEEVSENEIWYEIEWCHPQSDTYDWYRDSDATYASLNVAKECLENQRKICPEYTFRLMRVTCSREPVS